MEVIPKLTPEGVLVVAPRYNTPGKSDATGAFHVGAGLFIAYHFGQQVMPPTAMLMRYIDNRMAYTVRGTQLCLMLEEKLPRVVALFCHGWAHGIQLGISSKPEPAAKTIFARFVAALAKYPNPVVILYACSTGDHKSAEQGEGAPGAGDESFADLLRDALCKAGATHCRVVAHTTAGHSYYNPDVRIFDGNASESGGKGGVTLWDSQHLELRGVFRRLLELAPSDPRYGLPWRFPFMGPEEIRKVTALEKAKP